MIDINLKRRVQAQWFCPSPTRLLVTALLVCMIAASTLLSQGVVPSKVEQEKLLSALIEANFGVIYVDDGTADGSVTYKGQILGSGPNVKPDDLVKAVVNLRSTAIPLLIEHLDDTRPTKTLFKAKPTPLGHVALDILTHIIEPTSTIFILDCADDGLGACFQPGYYFRPDASLSEMRNVKERWQRAYRSDTIVFDYPSWWR